MFCTLSYLRPDHWLKKIKQIKKGIFSLKTKSGSDHVTKKKKKKKMRMDADVKFKVKWRPAA